LEVEADVTAMPAAEPASAQVTPTAIRLRFLGTIAASIACQLSAG
jgi:hypothetical protein